MTEPVIASLPIQRASLEQFAGPIAYAGEVATNLFVSGGRAIILRMGHHTRGQDENGQLVEAFVSGHDAKTDEIFLQAICDRPPDGGRREINPFTLNLWPLSTNVQPTTIEQALGPKLQSLPPYKVSPNHFALPFVSDQAFYLLRKMVSSIFAVAITRGAPQVEFILSRGETRTEKVMGTKIVTEKQRIKEKKRDADGKLIFKEASTPEGAPIYDPVCDKAGRPMMDPNTGEVRKIRRLIYETMEVDRDVQKIVPTEDEVTRTPIYLQVTTLEQISDEEFANTHAYESHYDPTWMLLDVLAGKCRHKKTFEGMEA